MWWRIKDISSTIRSWFHNCFNHKHMNVVREAFCGFPYDFAFIYRLEKAKLEEMLSYFEKGHIATQETYDMMISKIKLAISLLNIMLDETSLFDYDGELEFVESNYVPNSINEDDKNKTVYEVKTDNLKYKCLCHCNLRNLKRFINPNSKTDFFIKYPHELYVLKVKHLYYKLRLQYTEYWWD